MCRNLLHHLRLVLPVLYQAQVTNLESFWVRVYLLNLPLTEDAHPEG